MMRDAWDPELLTLRASVAKRTLAEVPANLVIDGLAATFGNDGFSIQNTKMLWDMGAQSTVIAEEVLSDSFREFLRGRDHDPYRVADGFPVQVDISIAFTNAAVIISAVGFVVPKARMPNEYEGIIFGQNLCIDRLVYRSIPRHILHARGLNIGDDVWGDIIVEQYLDLDDMLVSI
jgi:hypothetical protein